MRLLLALLVAALALGFTNEKMDFVQGSEKHVSIDLRDSDIVDVLKFLAQKGKFNVFVSPKIQGRVSLYLEDVRIRDILDIILLSNGLAYRERDSIVYVMTQEEYKARYGEDYGDAREVKILKLTYANPGQVFKMLEPTKSKVGSLVVDEQTGTLILIETPQKIRVMMKVVEEMDQPLLTKAFDLSYAKSKDVQSLIASQADAKGIATVSADERSNQVVVTALTRLANSS
jgi:type II secretory pathway component GspD/PulD (secretin)